MKDIDLVLEERDNARVLLTAFQAMLDSTSDILFIKDHTLTYLAASRPFVEMTGAAGLDHIIGHTDFEIFADQELARLYVEDDHKILASGTDLIHYTEPLPEENGSPRFATTSKHILRDRDGAIIGLMGVSRDITAQVIARQSYQKELEYLFTLPENVYAALFMDLHDWRIVSYRSQIVNQRVFPVQHTIEDTLEAAMQHISPDSEAYAFYRDFSKESLYRIYAQGKRTLTYEYLRSLPNSAMHWMRSELTFMQDPFSHHLCVMIVLRDIDPEKQAQAQIQRLAEIDEMTGLLNRATTMTQIRAFLSGEGRTGTHALLIIDVDNFKEINDLYGHQAGDEYLAQLAALIRTGFRKTDIVGRIGGDEFFVLMKDVSGRQIILEKSAALLSAMQSSRSQQGWKVSGSIGISFYEGDGTSLEQLYEQADQALYRAKAHGKNRPVFFSDPTEPEPLR